MLDDEEAASIKKLYRSARALIEHFHPDIVAAYAAGAALFIIISFFPFIIMLLSLLRYLPFGESELSQQAFDFMPDLIRDLLVSVIAEIAESNSAIIFPIAALTGLWTASTGFVSLTRGLNVVYGRKETRNYFRIRGICLLYTIIFLVIVVTMLGLVVFGNSIVVWTKNYFPSFSAILQSVTESRFLPTMIILTIFFTLLYKTVPDRQTRWFAEVPGAVISSIMWILFSKIYSLYISNMGRYSALYGSLTAVVLMMIWLYFCIYILFIGAYFNRMLKHTRLSSFIEKREEDERSHDQ